MAKREKCYDGGRHKWHWQDSRKEDRCIRCGKLMSEVICGEGEGKMTLAAESALEIFRNRRKRR